MDSTVFQWITQVFALKMRLKIQFIYGINFLIAGANSLFFKDIQVKHVLCCCSMGRFDDDDDDDDHGWIISPEIHHPTLKNRANLLVMPLMCCWNGTHFRTKNGET